MRLTIQQLAILVALLSLSFFFGALILAFGIRIAQEHSWQRFTVPRILWLGTTLLLLSSLAMEGARMALKRALIVIYRGRLAGTIALAAIFLCIQIVSAADLLSQGVAAAGNPHGGAFYAFMSIHGAHLLGGVAWLLFLRVRSKRLFYGTETDLRRHRRALSAAAIYWHFMGGLWLILYLCLLSWTAG